VLPAAARPADLGFARRYAQIGNADIMVGIPVYAPEAGLLDFIVQASGAFEETIRGILNLAALGQRVEIRVVVQRHNVPLLNELAVFIALDRRLWPFAVRSISDWNPTTSASAAPAQSATPAEESSPRAATASASICGPSLTTLAVDKREQFGLRQVG
jgi:hypothetical protein